MMKLPDLCRSLTDAQVWPETAHLKCKWMGLHFCGFRLKRWMVLMEKGQTPALWRTNHSEHTNSSLQFILWSGNIHAWNWLLLKTVESIKHLFPRFCTFDRAPFTHFESRTLMITFSKFSPHCTLTECAKWCQFNAKIVESSFSVSISWLI